MPCDHNIKFQTSSNKVIPGRFIVRLFYSITKSDLKMKKRISKVLLSLFCVLLFHSVSGQAGFSIGAKGGVTFSSFGGSDADNVKNRTGWVGGLFVNLSLLEVLSLQPEFLLQEKGARTITSDTRNEIRVSYFQIPVLVKLRVPIGEHVYPHLFAGPNFSYRVDASYTSTDTQTGQKRDVSVDNIRKTDTGGIVGVGVDFETNHGFFTLDARYGLGFQNLGDQSYNLHLKNRDLTVMAGIGFRLGTKKL